jgi:MFS family permease
VQFTPSVVLTFGYSRTVTQLLTVPPFMFAFLTTMVAGAVADHYRQRGLVAMATAALGILGCILNFSGTSLGIRYPALFFLIGGVYACTPSVLAWIPNNTAAYGKRAAVVALGFMVGNSGGILGVWIYPSKHAPRYLPATSANTAFLAATLALALGQVFYLTYLNRRKVDKRDDLLRGVEHLPLEEQIKKLGDHHPDFKYTL